MYYEPNFARPKEFLPERWLPDAPAEFSNDKHDVTHPFSYGPREYIGKCLAIAEMRLILAKMLWHFDMEFDNPKEDWYEIMAAYFVWDKGPLNIKLTAMER